MNLTQLISIIDRRLKIAELVLNTKILLIEELVSNNSCQVAIK